MPKQGTKFSVESLNNQTFGRENRCTHLWKAGPDGGCWKATHQILTSLSFKVSSKAVESYSFGFHGLPESLCNERRLFLYSSLQCTVTCGGGVQTRSVQCLRQGRPASGCLPHQKPAARRACNTNFCPVPVKRGKTVLRMLQQGLLLRTLCPAKIIFSSYTY